MAAVVGHAAADEPGVAALGHDRRAGLVANRDDLRDFIGAAWQQHQRRCAVEQAALVVEVAREVVVRVAPSGRADDALEPVEGQGVGASRHGPAARRRRSLIASPRPSLGTGMTAMPS